MAKAYAIFTKIIFGIVIIIAIILLLKKELIAAIVSLLAGFLYLFPALAIADLSDQNEILRLNLSRSFSGLENFSRNFSELENELNNIKNKIQDIDNLSHSVKQLKSGINSIDNSEKTVESVENQTTANTTDNWVCMNCYHTNPSGVKFCEQCGK